MNETNLCPCDYFYQSFTLFISETALFLFPFFSQYATFSVSVYLHLGETSQRQLLGYLQPTPLHKNSVSCLFFPPGWFRLVPPYCAVIG